MRKSKILIRACRKKLEEKEIKALSIELFEEFKKEKLRVNQWADKMETSAAVFNYVKNSF